MNSPPNKPAAGLIVASAATTRAVPTATSRIGTLCSTRGFGSWTPGAPGISFDIPFLPSGAAGAEEEAEPESGALPSGLEGAAADGAGGADVLEDFLRRVTTTAPATTPAVASPPTIP